MNRARIAGPVAVGLASLLGVSSALAGGRPAAADPGRDTVTVTGEGEVFGQPDILVANLSVETVAATVGKALGDAAAAAGKMRDALVRGGVAKDDLRTDNADVSSRTDANGKITGYAATEGLTATIRKLPRAGALMSSAIAAGGDAARLHGISYRVSNAPALLAEARKNAFADARGKAELYAGVAGRQLGPVVTVSEGTARGGDPVAQDGLRTAYAAMPVEPGRQRLTATVTVEWSFRP